MQNRKWQLVCCLLCWLAPCALAAEPVSTAWITNPAVSANPQLARVQPEVHAINVRERYVEIQSAGLSLYSLGALQTPPDHVERLRQLSFRIPCFPAPAKGAHSSVRPDVLGVFVNGVPLYNQFEAASYQGQNLWHFDPLAGGDDGARVANGYARDTTHSLDLGLLENLIVDGTRHSPLLGYAFDGYPIYGPWGYANAESKSLRRFRSSYRLRRIERRTAWPDGTALTPGQYGPPVNAEFPLGAFVEDYEYAAGDLDEFNGRFAVTPEYPTGTYAYFLATDERGRLAFPYLLAGCYYGQIANDELREAFRDAAASPDRNDDCAPQGKELLALAKPQLDLKVHGATLTVGQPLRLSFTIRQANGAPVRFLEYVHERPLHLLAVSEDLAEFAHIHPTLVAGDRYEVTHTFPRGGRWRLYADFTPPGSAQRVDSFALTLNGATLAVPLVADAVLRKERAGLTLSLTHQQPLRAGEEVELAFTIRDTQTGQPVSDLEPYLGAWAHFVIIDQRHESFSHAHPLEAPQFAQASTAPHAHNEATLGPPPAAIRTLTSFPRPGLYKLWAQFQRGGAVITQPFVLRVDKAPAHRAPVVTTIPADAIKLELGPHGYAPAQLTIAAGQPVTLAISCSQRPSCASRIVFPGLGLTRELPLNGTVIIELPALPAGELRFGCGMGMYKGALVVE